jgi:hypothetical protein
MVKEGGRGADDQNSGCFRNICFPNGNRLTEGPSSYLFLLNIAAIHRLSLLCKAWLWPLAGPRTTAVLFLPFSFPSTIRNRARGTSGLG